MQHKLAAALGLAIVLISSSLLLGMTPSSFAVTVKEDKSVGQHVVNDEQITIDSLEFHAKKKKKSEGTVLVEINQNGVTIGSTEIDVDDISHRKFKKVLAVFADPVEVAAENFDIVISYDGDGGINVKYKSDRKSKIPGNLFEGTKEFPKRDLRFEINPEANGNNGNNGNNHPPADPTPTITIAAENIDDHTAINGLWAEVWKGTDLLASGFTPFSYDVVSGEKYTIAVSDWETTEFVKWKDNNSKIQFRPVTITADRTYTALFDTDGGGSTDTGGDPGTGGTPTDPAAAGGPNTVTVNSQLLDGTSVGGYQVQLRASGTIIDTKFTPATFALEPDVQYVIVMYWTGDDFYRHFTDGTLTRYHFVTASDTGQLLTAVYERIPPAQQTQLNIIAKTTDGQYIGGTTGSETDNTLSVTPGVWMTVGPAGSPPYTGGFSGGSSLPFTLVMGESYNLWMYEFDQYQFSHWEDTLSTDRSRDFTMIGDIEAVAIYNVVASSSTTSESGTPQFFNVDG